MPQDFEKHLKNLPPDQQAEIAKQGKALDSAGAKPEQQLDNDAKQQSVGSTSTTPNPAEQQLDSATADRIDSTQQGAGNNYQAAAEQGSNSVESLPADQKEAAVSAASNVPTAGAEPER